MCKPNRLLKIARCFVCSLALPACAQNQPAPPDNPFLSFLSDQAHQVANEFRNGHNDCKQAVETKTRDTWLFCMQDLFSNSPLTVKAGTIASGNGVALGLGYDYGQSPQWAISDFRLGAMGSTNSSWESDASWVLKFTPTSVFSSQNRPQLDTGTQSQFLTVLPYFGLGNNTITANRAFYSLFRTIVGVKYNQPVKKTPIDIFGQLSGEWYGVGGSTGQSSPSIESTYTEADAPGLTVSPHYLDYALGVTILNQPVDRFRYAYHDTVQINDLVATNVPQYGFRKYSVNLNHSFFFYRVHKEPMVGRNAAASVDQWFRIDLRGLLTESVQPAGHTIPFYLMPTLGGTNIDGDMLLPSYDDYRFRAPNALAGKVQVYYPLIWIFGLTVTADTGKVGTTRGEIDISHMRHSFGTGITLNFGGRPYVNLIYAWGGNDSSHGIFNFNSSIFTSSSSATPALWSTETNP